MNNTLTFEMTTTYPPDGVPLEQMVEWWYNTGVNHAKSSGLLKQHRYPFSTYVRGVDTMSNHTLAPYFPKNLEDYALWVATHGLTAPYGECQCGCGLIAPTARQSHTAYGYLRYHPKRYAHGHWGKTRTAPTTADAFWSHLTPGDADECWLWQGAIGANGYGAFMWKRKTYAAHRMAYEITNGPIASDLLACHKCDVRACCNAAHIFPGTQLDNSLDSVAKGRNARGEKNHWAKLDASGVTEIRAMRASNSKITYVELGVMHGVSEATIRDAVSRKTWKHVP